MTCKERQIKTITLFVVCLFAFGASASAATPTIVVAPKTVKAGRSFRLRGWGFTGKAHLTIFATTKGQRARFGWAVTDPWGRFRAKFGTHPRTIPGRFRITACRKKTYSEKASTTITIRK